MRNKYWARRVIGRGAELRKSKHLWKRSAPAHPCDVSVTGRQQRDRTVRTIPPRRACRMLQVAEAAPIQTGAVNATDDARDYALLRRAICERDDVAWAGVLERYTRLVRSWVRQHQAL